MSKVTATIPTRVGFTGTRRGMTDAQRSAVADLLREATYLHHGDCVGADADAHAIGLDAGVLLAVHPPSDDRLRAFKQGDLMYPPKPYHDRNRDIVDCTDHLIATPGDYEESPRGGTWYTVRYAREQGKTVTVVWPDGTLDSGSEREGER